MVTIPVHTNIPRCPACGDALVVTLQGTALGEAITATNDLGLQAPNQSKVYVSWHETDIELDPINLECTACSFVTPWSSVSFSGVTP